MNEQAVEIVVDGLPVEVDKAEYEASPDTVIEEIRTARAGIVGDLSGLHDVAPDFDEMEARFASEASE